MHGETVKFADSLFETKYIILDQDPYRKIL